MTGKEIYIMGASSAAARACIPLQMQQTAPRLIRKDGCWIAEFWYYAVDSEELSVRAPQFYLALELPGGHPVEMKRLSTNAALLGNGSDVLDHSFHQFLEDYLHRCTEILEGTPDPEKIKKLWKQWRMTSPFAVAVWLQEHLEEPEMEFSNQQEPADRLLETDPVAYWKKMQVKAIREGDDAAAQKARLEMNKAAAKLRKR